jgi:hypothetical protein
MNDRLNRIGFSQRIRLEWLQQTAELVSAGKTRDEIHKILREMLQDKISVGSNAKRGNREKTISILLKTWLAVPPGLAALRDTALELMKALHQDYHIVLHWGMTMAVYPFWGAAAANVGRLLRLQGSFSVSQVQRRMREQYGERETVSRANLRIIRCFFDWKVINETPKRGVYSADDAKKISDNPLILWLIEAILNTTRDLRSSFKEVVNSPALFPFVLAHITPDQLKESHRIEIIKQNIDEDFLILRIGNYTND